MYLDEADSTIQFDHLEEEQEVHSPILDKGTRMMLLDFSCNLKEDPLESTSRFLQAKSSDRRYSTVQEE